MAAWITTSNSCLGISSFILTARACPFCSDLARWQISDSASTGSPFTRRSSLTMSLSWYPANW